MGRLIDADKLIKYLLTPPYNVGWDDEIEIINNQPTVEAIPKTELRKMLRDCSANVSDSILDIVKEEYIPKADYEIRLKADMVAMLTEIDMELDELTPPEFSTNYYSHGIIDAQVIIQKKIDALKET